MPLTVVVALLPAWSVAVPITDCPAPLPDSVTGDGQFATPDPSSVQVRVTVPSFVVPDSPVTAPGGEAGRSVTFTVAEPSAVAPSAVVIRSATCCGPGAAKVWLVTGLVVVSS